MKLSTLNIPPQKEKQFNSRGIYTVEDLLQFLPRKYNDYRKLTGILPPDQVSLIRVQLTDSRTFSGGKAHMFFANGVEEQSGKRIRITWFNTSWLYRDVNWMALNHETVIVGGKIEYDSRYGYGITQPEVFEKGDKALKIYPIYKTIPRMSAEYLAKTMQDAIDVGLTDSEILPRYIVDQYNVVSMPVALKYIHMPKTMEEVEQGRQRILFNDLLYFAIHNELNSTAVSAGSQYNIKSRALVNKIIKGLTYTLTPDQDKAVKEMLHYGEDGRRIHALIQGDTGAGKTQIAVLMAAAFVDSGYQAVIMAPTQVLAKQHYQSISQSLEPYGIKSVYLDGKLKKKDRTDILKSIENGTAQLIIGTQACVASDVVYHDLALTIVDEEHRFGVNQRAAIVAKASRGVHSITMSATPIPRSLAQVVYGDNIQLQTIQTMPNGRKPVLTRVFKKQSGNMKFILKEVQAGHQAYVVCPIIETSEKVPGLKSVETVSKEYQEFFEPHGVRIETLTGKTSTEETEEIIAKFQKREIDILIATTVIEVGVNIPNATVIVITNAERFGLSSLHQLRGRVGRSALQSYCILQSADETPTGLARLQVMCDTNDGFKIAEADLEQRGAGDLLGTQQSGENKYVSLMMKNPERYQDALAAAKELLGRGRDCCQMLETIFEERESKEMD